jgi:hypothetical protein
VSAATWVYIGFAVQMMASAEQNEITFIINDSNSVATTTTGHYFLDRSGGTEAHIGAMKDSGGNLAEQFKGFIFIFYIDDGYLTANWYIDQATCICVGGPCVSDTSTCLWNVEFINHTGGACDSCSSGCRRAEAC